MHFQLCCLQSVGVPGFSVPRNVSKDIGEGGMAGVRESVQIGTRKRKEKDCPYEGRKKSSKI